MRLFLLRHAEAGAHADDAARALTEPGWAQADAVAAWVADRVHGEVVVLSSPLQRAQQTASRVRLALPGARFASVSGLEPDADILQAEQALALQRGDAEVLVAVSHMPLLGSLAHWLTEGVLGIGEPFGLAEVRVFETEVIAPGLLVEAARHRPDAGRDHGRW